MCARVANGVHIRTHKNICVNAYARTCMHVICQVKSACTRDVWALKHAKTTNKCSSWNLFLYNIHHFALALFTWGIVSYICTPPPQLCVCQSAQSYYIFQMLYIQSWRFIVQDECLPDIYNFIVKMIAVYILFECFLALCGCMSKCAADIMDKAGLW